MKIKKIFLIQILLIVIMFFSSFLQETFFIHKNFSLPIKQVEKVCSSNGNFCISAIDWTNINKDVDVEIVVDIFQYQPIFNSIIYVLFGLVLLAFIIFLKNKRKIALENGDAKEKLSILTVFLFSLFAMYKILFLYTNNILEISFSFPLILITIFFCAFFLFYKLFSYFLKNDSEALIVTFVLILFLSNIKTLQMYITNIYIDISLLLTVISFLLLLKIKTEKIILFLKPVAITLILLCVLNGVGKLGQFFFNQTFSKDKTENIVEKSNYQINKELKRDIYIIILDMYPAKETTDLLGYDNSPFISQLKERGFLVFENILSNYNKTATSVPSILNFDYVGNLSNTETNSAVENSRFFEFSKINNYKVFYLNSWPTVFDVKETNNIDKVIVSTSQNNKYIQKLLLNGNILDYFFDFLFDDPKLNLGLKYVDNIIADKATKKASFIHLLMPHWPYLYDIDGNKLKDTSDIKVSKNYYHINEKSFLSFLQFTNKVTIEYIDKIITSKKEKPIIIITGDHGIREEYSFVYESELYMEQKKNKDIMKKRFNTLLAYYNPDMEKETYKDVKTLVNFFRKFSNEIFKTNYHVLPDKQFYILYSSIGDDFSTVENRELNL